jgi:hypothetical protein
VTTGAGGQRPLARVWAELVFLPTGLHLLHKEGNHEVSVGGGEARLAHGIEPLLGKFCNFFLCLRERFKVSLELELLLPGITGVYHHTRQYMQFEVTQSPCITEVKRLRMRVGWGCRHGQGSAAEIGTLTEVTSSLTESL